MASPFVFIGGNGVSLTKRITSNAATVVFDPTSASGKGVVRIDKFRVSETNGGTQNLTVALYDVAGTTYYYLGSGGFTWKAKAVTAYQSLLFDDGYVIPQGWQLRIQSSDASGFFDVVGIRIQ